MLLAIDIGNTDTVVGIFNDEELAAHFRVASAANLTVDEAGLFVRSLFSHHSGVEASQVDRVAICSVVPYLTGIYEEMARKYFNVEPLTIGPDIKLPVTIEYPEPAEIGADRLANAAAGYALYGTALIIVDIGTATTFDIVSANGAYIGGVIAPGPETAAANLAQKAARLFQVRSEKPERAIGKSTAGAIKSGLYYGTIGLIDNILDRIIEELGLAEIDVIATGGAAMVFTADSRHISEVMPTLTLEGIRLIADCNIPPQ